MHDHISKQKIRESLCPVSPILSNYFDNSSTTSAIINSKSGTIRGNLNHVKTSVKKVFEREALMTYPVLNAQLNDVSITSLHQSNNYNEINDSINLSPTTEFDESVYSRIIKLNGKSLNFLAVFNLKSIFD